MSYHRQDALDCHSSGRRGKVAVVPTRAASTRRDLSLAYSHGAARPVMEGIGTPDGSANVLIFPDLNSAHIAYKRMARVGGAEAFGAILRGMAHPVHVLQRGGEAVEVADLTALAVVDAQSRSDAPQAG